MERPVVVLVVAFLVLWAAARLGAHVFQKAPDFQEAERDSFGFIMGAVLTLLALLIGFTFTMAVGRYDQRKNYEEEEANTIGTEYLRLELLPPADAARIQQLLAQYLEQRILFYQTLDSGQLDQIGRDTTQLQQQLWTTVRDAARVQPSPLSALAVAGMNDALDAQGYTQAAFWNRIPAAGWALMAAIAVGCNVLLGWEVRHSKRRPRNLLLLILPLVLAVSFFLVADIDSPRGGFIRVHPQNLLSLAQSLQR